MNENCVNAKNIVQKFLSSKLKQPKSEKVDALSPSPVCSAWALCIVKEHKSFPRDFCPFEDSGSCVRSQVAFTKPERAVKPFQMLHFTPPRLDSSRCCLTTHLSVWRPQIEVSICHVALRSQVSLQLAAASCHDQKGRRVQVERQFCLSLPHPEPFEIPNAGDWIYRFLKTSDVTEATFFCLKM